LGKLEIVLDPANNMHKHKKDLIQPSAKKGNEGNPPLTDTEATIHAAHSPSNPTLQLVIDWLDGLQTFMTKFCEENWQ